jgi:hypothetical protein
MHPNPPRKWRNTARSAFIPGLASRVRITLNQAAIRDTIVSRPTVKQQASRLAKGDIACFRARLRSRYISTHQPAFVIRPSQFHMPLRAGP